MPSCPVCQSVADANPVGDKVKIRCPRCGDFSITDTVMKSSSFAECDKEKLSYATRRLSDRKQVVEISSIKLGKLLSEAYFPPPHEQADNFVLWLGGKLEDNPAGDHYYQDGSHLCGVVGARDNRGVYFVLSALKEKRYINYNQHHAGLTFEGWERYHQLKYAKVESRVAFMAMDFNKKNVLKAYETCFKPAVKRAGFDLRPVNREDQPTGNITDFIRVDIRRSRFIVADLTHGNLGAYWEAGFAEGIGIPVFFTCENSYFEKSGTHFDVKTYKTVKWDENNLDKAKKELTASIRATLPVEADLDDLRKDNNW